MSEQLRLDEADLPRDEDVRRTIRHEHGRTIFVDAGAGTGKTTALVERIVNLVTDTGVTVDRIAAITFTEAAATELRRRVREKLERRQLQDDPDGRVSAALESIDDAAFTTLHAFAYRLLREHPLEVGLPPEVELVTDVDEAIAFELRWQQFLDELFDDERFALVAERLAILGLSLRNIREIAEKLHQDLDRAAELPAPPETLPDPDADEVIAAVREVVRVRDEVCRDGADRLAAHVDAEVRPYLAALEQATGTTLLSLLVGGQKLRPASNAGAAKAWGDAQGKALVHETIAAAEAARERVRTAQCDALARLVASHLARFVTGWAADRRAAGQLSFADLLVLARELLGDEAVRRAVREQFTHVLVDEFQDTDPIQYDLALAIGCDPDGDGTIEPGRLFFVGDPKQSIYGFRRADIGIYERARSRERDVEPVDLTENFRSDPAVVDWVNAAFGQLIRHHEGSQPPYTELVAHRPVGPGRVERFGGAHDLRAAEVRVAEAEDTAALIRSLVHDERVPPSDIAVLVRRHSTVRLLERTLTAADVPYRIESRSLVYQTDEVRSLVALLQAIADPEDEVALVAALRHPAIGCSDLDLTDHVHAGGRWSLFAHPPEGVDPSHPVLTGIATLRRLHDDRWRLGVGAFVDHVIDELRLRELAFAHRRPRDRWRRLQLVADQARRFHEAGGDLRSFLRWIEREMEAGVRIDEHVVEEPDDRSVRITTVHGAKGLEYPVVVLLGNDADVRRPPTTPRVLWPEDGTEPELSLQRDLRTSGWDDAMVRVGSAHEHEETRLLYVGATRAADRLIVSCHHKAGADCHASRLLALDGLDGLWAELDVPPVPDLARLPGPAALPDDDLLAAERDAEERWVAGRRELLEPHRRASAVAATTVAALVGTGGQEHADGDDVPADGITEDATAVTVPDGAPTPKGRGGTAVGRAVHAVLQSVDLAAFREGGEAAAAQVAALARSQAAVEGVPDAVETIERLAGNALRSSAVRAAARSDELHRELHVGVPVEGADGRTFALEGFIDLLYRDADGWVVVDYKTDTLGGRSPDAAAQRYRGQAATYALALQRILGEPVVRCVFVFTEGPHEAVLAGDALAGTEALVEAAATRATV